LPAGVHRLPAGPGAEALLAVPPGDDGPRPLLVFFHGAGATARRSLDLLGGVADDRGVVVLAPTWNLLADGLGRDVAVLDAALAEASAHVAVSRRAVGGFAGFDAWLR
jgi:poly(3-hydroxybutyrate) depolymerase